MKKQNWKKKEERKEKEVLSTDYFWPSFLALLGWFSKLQERCKGARFL